MAQPPVELTAAALVAPYVLVDGLVANVQAAFVSQPSTDLLGTEIVAQQIGNELPIGGREVALAS